MYVYYTLLVPLQTYVTTPYVEAESTIVTVTKGLCKVEQISKNKITMEELVSLGNFFVKSSQYSPILLILIFGVVYHVFFCVYICY